MLFTHLALFALTALMSSSAIPNEHLPVADPSTHPMSQSILEVLDGIDDLGYSDDDSEKVMYEHVPSIEERDVSFDQYSRVANLNGLWQWTFGNTTHQYNISVDTCVRTSDVAGVWDFEDGSRKYNATLGEIMADLGVGKTYGSPERYAARSVSNDLLADSEGRDFLQASILCKSNPTNPSKSRDLLSRDDRDPTAGLKLAIVQKTAFGLMMGMLFQMWYNLGQANAAQLTGGALGGAVVILGLEIIAYRQMVGRYDAWEAWIGGVWSAMLRWFVYLAKGAPGVAGPCVQEIELVAMGGQLGDSSDPALRFEPLNPPVRRSQSCPRFTLV